MSSNNKSNPIKKLESWTQQQQEACKATAAADKERSALLEQLSQLKARTAKTRQATSQAKDALGKYHEISRHLQAKKKHLEQQLDKDRLQLESCAKSTQNLNEEFSAFRKKAADSYKALNAELMQVLRDQDHELVKSYITDDTLEKLQGVNQCPEFEEMQATFAERASLVTTREALMEKVEAFRSRALKSNDPVRAFGWGLQLSLTFACSRLRRIHCWISNADGPTILRATTTLEQMCICRSFTGKRKRLETMV